MRRKQYCPGGGSCRAITIGLSLSLALCLAACGGSSSSSRPNNIIFDDEFVGTQALIAAVARSTPRKGSVTQGTRVSSGVTLDEVEAVLRGQELRVSVNTGTTQLVADTGQVPAEDVESSEDIAALLAGLSASLSPIAHPLGRRIGSVGVVQDTGNRWAWVHILSDLVDGAGSVLEDYVSFGVWGYGRVIGDDVRVVDQWGVFADGVETASGDIPSTGTADYAGYSLGVYGSGTEDPVAEFVADVALQANFATSLVSGSVRNFRIEDPNPEADNPFFQDSDLVVALQAAPLVDGFFTGDARATGQPGVNAVGKWGGQFFGTPAAGGDAPPAVGGTWGVQEANRLYAIGGFGAWLE